MLTDVQRTHCEASQNSPVGASAGHRKVNPGRMTLLPVKLSADHFCLPLFLQTRPKSFTGKLTERRHPAAFTCSQRQDFF